MTLVLTHSEISQLLDREQLRKAVEDAFTGLALGDYENPAPRALSLPERGVALPMVATGGGRTAVKLLSDLPHNRARGLPTQRSTIMVMSAVTGECIALLDGRAITAARTAAASAVATDHLARDSASVLGFVGAGNLAVEHAYAIAAVREVTQIVVWSRTTATADTFRVRAQGLGVRIENVSSPEHVFGAADIVCTLTPSQEPIVSGSWFRPGQHINAVGAPPRPDHREIDAIGMRRARIVVDSAPTVLAKSGGVLMAVAEGAIDVADASTELSQVIVGAAAGRRTDSDITLFESVGLGLQDLAAANLVIDRATERGVGIDVTLSGG